MTIDRRELELAAELVTQAGSLREAAAELRRHFPEMRASVADTLDMRDEEPVLCLPACNLYLMQTDGHCWQMTRNPALASAFVLAGN